MHMYVWSSSVFGGKLWPNTLQEMSLFVNFSSFHAHPPNIHVNLEKLQELGDFSKQYISKNNNHIGLKLHDPLIFVRQLSNLKIAPLLP